VDSAPTPCRKHFFIQAIQNMSAKIEIKDLSTEKKVEILRDFVDDWAINMEHMCIDLLQEYLDSLFGERVKKSGQLLS
jgi:hypothetical protein